LVGVAVVGGSAGRGGEEVWEEFGFVKAGKREDGEDGSGRAWRGDAGYGGSGDRRQEVLDWDVGKRDTLNDFFELAVGILVLVLGLGGVLKLRAFYVSLLGGDVSEDAKEVGRSDSGVREDSGGDEGQGAVLVETRAVTIRAWIVPGVVRTIEKVLDDLGSSSEVLLVDVIDL
jgi:hypothetical protein